MSTREPSPKPDPRPAEPVRDLDVGPEAGDAVRGGADDLRAIVARLDSNSKKKEQVRTPQE